MPRDFQLPPSLLVALGGNAITRPDEVGDIKDQYRHTEESMLEIVDLLKRGQQKLVITHGNGPQVGNILLRAELAESVLYPLPLDVCVADSQGGMGYMIQQVLDGLLREHGLDRTAATIVTQVLVDNDDPAFANPTKYIGRAYSEEEAAVLIANRGWSMRDDIGRGWRRVVPSPAPKEIIELEAIKALMDAGLIVVAGGGGGIPVRRLDSGDLVGVEGVIDKDMTSALLGAKLGIHTMLILTGVETVMIGFRTPKQRALHRVSASELSEHSRSGEFPVGSMGPKVMAALAFLENGGKRVVITEVGKGEAALAGETGTEVLA